jgi:predicted small secreted protein
MIEREGCRLRLTAAANRRHAGCYREYPMVPARLGRYAPGMNSSLKRLALLLLAAAFLALATTACQTSKGFGKDVEKLGDKIQEKSR